MYTRYFFFTGLPIPILVLGLILTINGPTILGTYLYYGSTILGPLNTLADNKCLLVPFFRNGLAKFPHSPILHYIMHAVQWV